MSGLLKTYTFMVCVAAVTSAVALPTAGMADNLWTLVVLCALAAFTGARSVRIPHLSVQVTPGDAFVFCSLLAVGPMAAPLVGLFGTAGALAGINRRPPSIRIAFNLGAVTLSASAAAWLYIALTRVIDAIPGGALTVLLGSVATFFLVNTFLVAIAVGLERRRGFITTWVRSGMWTATSSLASALLALGLLYALEAAGPFALAMGLAGTATVGAALSGAHRTPEPAVGHELESAA